MTADVGAMDASICEQQLDHRERNSEDVDADAEHEDDDLADAQPKKKRRIVKISDKKYDCPHPECGKSYSRAEHLYRHQLNRTHTNGPIPRESCIGVCLQLLTSPRYAEADLSLRLSRMRPKLCSCRFVYQT